MILGRWDEEKLKRIKGDVSKKEKRHDGGW